jgi:hypothetical protein
MSIRRQAENTESIDSYVWVACLVGALQSKTEHTRPSATQTTGRFAPAEKELRG